MALEAAADSRTRGLVRRTSDWRTLAKATAATTVIALVAAATPSWEVAAFEAVNGLSHDPERALWVIQQLGNAWAIPVGAFLLWLLVRRWQPPVALLASSSVFGWALADVVRETVGRERPAALVAGVQTGFDVPSAGPAFPSGHAIVVMTLAVVLAPYVSRRIQLTWLAAALAAMALRVYSGAHLPLDVIGGATFGVAVGSIARLVGGVLVDEAGGMEPG